MLRTLRRAMTVADPDARAEGLAVAARAVRGGRLVVLPTDTVYGLGCDAFNPEAVRGLLAAKHRGPDMPAPVLVGSWSTIDGLVMTCRAPRATSSRRSGRAGCRWCCRTPRRWPGISADQGHGDAADAVAPGRARAAARRRADGRLQRQRVGPAAASDAAMAEGQLGDSVEVYLDGGPSGEPVASTIVDLTADEPRILREGAITAAQVSDVLGRAVLPA